MSNPDGTTNDPEALGEERDEYPDPESYPKAQTPAEETSIETPADAVDSEGMPDPDIAVENPSG